MSNLRHAELGWGFPLLNDEGEPSFVLDTEKHIDEGEFIAACYGLRRPTLPYEGNKAIYEQYWDAKRELLARIGVEIHDHNVDDTSSESVLVIAKSWVVASSRHSPTVLPETLVPMPEWLGMIEAFCKQTGIPFRPPSWVLWVSWDH